MAPTRIPIALAVTLAFAGLTAVFATRNESEWRNVFVKAAADLGGGRDVYHADTAYIYPPFMAFASLPFTHVPPWIGTPLWAAANVAGLAAGVWAVRVGLAAAGATGRHAAFALAIGMVIALPPVVDCVTHGQTDLIVNGLVLAGCALLCRRRALTAAFAWGMAAACKATPLLWVAPLALRRRWIAATTLFAVCIAANLLPELVARSPEERIWLERWYVRFIAPMQRADYVPGTWGSEVVYNQSLAGAWQRWTHTRFAWDGGTGMVEPATPTLSPAAFRIGDKGIKVAAAVGLVLALIAMRRSQNESLACGVVLAAMLLLSPMSSKTHFGTLAWPAALLTHRWLSARRLTALVALILAAACMVALNRDIVGRGAYTLALWSGSAMIAAVALGVGCVVEGTRRPAALPAAGHALRVAA